MAGASMQPIYERLNAVAGYNPLTADTFGDWAMEAGDIVKVVRGTEEYNVPIHSSTLVWRGKQRISIDSTGKKERDSIAKASAQKYGRGGAAVRGQQGLYQHFESEDNSIRSEFAISYESLRVQFENEITSTRSEFQMTSESLRIQFENEIASTRSEFQMTSESLRIQFENEIASTRSEFQMTSESLRIHFESEISSTRSDIEVQANRIGLVVSGTGANARIRPAQIVASINNSSSEVLLDADKVKISGTTTINDVMTITDSRLHIQVPARIQGDAMVESLTLRYAQDSITLTEADLETVIKSASVSGNTLTLTPMKGDPITFSKATTLTGAWSGGIYTVSASPQSVSNSTYLSGLMEVANTTDGWDGNTYRSHVAYVNSQDDPTKKNTGYQVSVDASSRYTAGQNNVTITKGSWSSGIISFTKSAGTASTKSVQLTAAAASWNGNTASVVMWDGTAADAQHGVSTGYTVTVDASARYTAGQNAVTLNDASWNSVSTVTASRTVTVSTSGRPTQLSKSKTVHLTVGTWSNGSIPIYIRDGSTSGTIVAQNSVSAPSATVSAGSWSNGKVTVTAKHGTASLGSTTVTMPTVTISVGTWTNGTASLNATHGTYNAGSNVVNAPTMTLSFDCTDLVDPQYSEGDKNDNAITGTAKHGTASKGTGTQVVHMTQGSWSSGHKAVNCRMTNDSGKLLNRIWVTLPTTASWSYSYISSSVGYQINCTIGGKTYTTTHKF